MLNIKSLIIMVIENVNLIHGELTEALNGNRLHLMKTFEMY